jgi:hypothetical protein
VDDQEIIKPGDRVVLHGEIADMRGDFCLVTVAGSAPDSSYLSVDCGHLEQLDRAVMHGGVTAIRDGFAVVNVDGSLPPGCLISVQPSALRRDNEDDPQAEETNPRS